MIAASLDGPVSAALPSLLGSSEYKTEITDCDEQHFEALAERHRGRTDSTLCFASPDQTLIFFDFDDTLFPTTDLFDRWAISTDWQEWQHLQLSPEQERQLDRWRASLAALLDVATGLSEHVAVITNARRPWVARCLERFAPELLPRFHGKDARFSVRYASDFLSSPKSPRPTLFPSQETQQEIQLRLTSAKFAVMKEEAKLFYSRYPGQTWKNIISFGDASYERDALLDLSFTRVGPQREQLRVKSVLIGREPFVSDLNLRHRVWAILLPALVSFSGDLDLDLQTTSARMQNLSDALGIDLPQQPFSVTAKHPWPDEDNAVCRWLVELTEAVRAAKI